MQRISDTGMGIEEKKKSVFECGGVEGREVGAGGGGGGADR